MIMVHPPGEHLPSRPGFMVADSSGQMGSRAKSEIRPARRLTIEVMIQLRRYVTGNGRYLPPREGGRLVADVVGPLTAALFVGARAGLRDGGAWGRVGGDVG